ncbi:MAG TPA: hypothetical protein VN397_01535 [Candidatus Methylomirabilis sp.]|nr:hypothetical protein [Candidatus Methylomirabilis sp.]
MNMNEFACKDQKFAAKLAHYSQIHGKYSSLDGIAVFTLSDLCGFTPRFRNQSRIAVCGAHGPNTSLYSTGKLERALYEGCDVWVILSRHEFHSSDDWFRCMLPLDRVRKMNDRSSNLIEPWFEVTLELRSMLTKQAQGNGYDLIRIDWVDDLKVFLGSYGVEFGDAFNGFADRSTWKKV